MKRKRSRRRNVKLNPKRRPRKKQRRKAWVSPWGCDRTGPLRHVPAFACRTENGGRIVPDMAQTAVICLRAARNEIVRPVFLLRSREGYGACTAVPRHVRRSEG